MNILGLPGKNDATGPWLDDIVNAVRSPGDNVATQYYHAWNARGSKIDNELEIDIASIFDPDLIVAKSMGTILTMLGVSRKQLKPRQAVLIGVPVNALHSEQRTLLSNWDKTGIQTLLIQQTADITGSFGKLAEVVPSSAQIALVEIEGSDHVYADISEIIRIIRDWR